MSEYIITSEDRIHNVQINGEATATDWQWHAKITVRNHDNEILNIVECPFERSTPHDEIVSEMLHLSRFGIIHPNA